MSPADTGPRRRNLRRAARGVPTGRRATRLVKTTYGRHQKDRDQAAEFSEFCAQRREAQEAAA